MLFGSLLLGSLEVEPLLLGSVLLSWLESTDELVSLSSFLWLTSESVRCLTCAAAWTG